MKLPNCSKCGFRDAYITCFTIDCCNYDCQFYSEKHFDWVMQERRKEWEAAESLKIDGPEPLEERDFND